jgi:hypothetical protein
VDADHIVFRCWTCGRTEQARKGGDFSIEGFRQQLVVVTVDEGAGEIRRLEAGPSADAEINTTREKRFQDQKRFGDFYRL